MEFTVPDGCRITDRTLQAESEEAFNQALGQLGLYEGSPQRGARERDGELYGYKYRFAYGRAEDGSSINLRGPRVEMRLVPADA